MNTNTLIDLYPDLLVIPEIFIMLQCGKLESILNLVQDQILGVIPAGYSLYLPLFKIIDISLKDDV